MEATETPVTGKIDYSKSYPVKNCIQLMNNQRDKGDKVALHYKQGGEWRNVTWNEVHQRVARIAEGFVGLGVKKGDRVAIFADTCFDWIVVNMALWCVGAAVVPVYGSDTPEEISFIVQDSGACLIVLDHDMVDHHKQPGRWNRVKSVLGQMPAVRKVVAFSLPTDESQNLMSLVDLESIGAKALEGGKSIACQTVDQVGWDDMATLLYTSGTTGRPKGVILTHGNWVSQSYNVMAHGVLEDNDDVMLFLPLAHSFGLEVISTWMGQNVTISLAESIDRLLDNCREIHPTVLPAVPRVFEKAFNRIVTSGHAAEGIQGSAFDWAMDLFDKYADARTAGRSFHSLKFPLAKKLVFGPVSQKLSDLFGGRMRCCVSGGAPLTPRIAYFFEMCGLCICEGFGMTETSASTHCNLDGRNGRPANTIGNCGPAFPQVEVKIAEDGEVLLRGPQVMKGYFNLPKETEDALSADGWLKTGDIGNVDDKNILRITDRKKDLIKTSGGKYVAPAELENDLKANPIVSQVSIQGDRRKFISAVFTLDKGEVARVAAAAGVDKPFAELVNEPCVVAEVQKAVDALNARQPSYATIKKFILLDHDWSQETGEMTPTLKVKRRVVGEKYKKQLDALYGD